MRSSRDDRMRSQSGASRRRRGAGLRVADLAGRPATALLACVLTLALALAATPLRASASPASVSRALDYLHACQRSDGGFAEKTKTASADAVTAWAIVGIAASGEDPRTWRVEGHSPVDFLARGSSSWSATSDFARTTLAVVAAHENPRSFAGVDLVAQILADVHDRGDDGDQIGAYVNSHVWGMIALEAAGHDVSGAETTWLLKQQNVDGGWGWAPSVSSDTNDSAAAIEALVASGQSPSSSAIKRALAYLRSRQAADGGFLYQNGSQSDADSTAWVMQALAAGGQSAASWTSHGKTPAARLRTLQGSDGSIAYSGSARTNPLLVTVQALPALAGRPFPLRNLALHSHATFRPTVKPRWPAPGQSVAWLGDSDVAFTIDDGAGVGVDQSGISVTVDGVARASTLNVQTGSARVSALGVGSHVAVVRVSDRAGNLSVKRSWRFTVASVSASLVGASNVATNGANNPDSTVTASAADATGKPGPTTAVASGVRAAAAASPSTTPSSALAQPHPSDAASDALTKTSIVVALACLGAAAALVGWRLSRRR